jgi:hypothetical protein
MSVREGARPLRGVALALTVLLTTLLAAAATSSADPQGTRHCAKGWTFDIRQAYPTRQSVAERKRAVNRTRHANTVTFISSKSKTVTWSASGSVGGGLDAILFSVKSEVDGSVSESATATTGISVQATVPPHRAVSGTYGVFIRPVKGVLYKGDSYDVCRVIRHIRVKLPAGTGWLTAEHHL